MEIKPLPWLGVWREVKLRAESEVGSQPQSEQKSEHPRHFANCDSVAKAEPKCFQPFLDLQDLLGKRKTPSTRSVLPQTKTSKSYWQICRDRIREMTQPLDEVLLEQALPMAPGCQGGPAVSPSSLPLHEGLNFLSPCRKTPVSRQGSGCRSVTQHTVAHLANLQTSYLLAFHFVVLAK